MTPTDSIVVDADPDTVFDVLCDPQAYVTWVVGAHRLRDVDRHWPAEGARFHHAIGLRPVEMQDSTTMRHCDRPHLVQLEIKARPIIVADVEFRLEPTDGRTRITMSERPTGGLLWLAGPLSVPLLTLRNRLALHRLAALLERRGRSAA